jgi:hypothetical protein
VRLEKWEDGTEVVPVDVGVEGQERPPPRVVSGG